MVGLRDVVIARVQEHLKKTQRGKVYPRTVPRFIVEAIESQIERERVERRRASHAGFLNVMNPLYALL